MNLQLYSFRRCPYAIRARMALVLSELSVSIIEVKLSNKPQALLELSPKGTVPVFHLVDEGQVIDESIDIISFAHQHMSTQLEWQPNHQLIQQNDDEFKPLLDRYKYFERYPDKTQQEHRQAAYPILNGLEERLQSTSFLLGEKQSLLDIAIMPFIRQFAKSDDTWWKQQILFPKLKTWLDFYLHSELFIAIMKKDLKAIN